MGAVSRLRGNTLRGNTLILAPLRNLTSDSGFEPAVISPRDKLKQYIQEFAVALDVSDVIVSYGVSSYETIRTLAGGKAYCPFGGFSPPGTYGLDMSTDAAFQTNTLSPSGTSEISGAINATTAGYFGGGYTTSYINSIVKLVFSTVTYSTLSATLAAARGPRCTVTKSRDTKGFFIGGEDGSGPGLSTEIDALVFSSETADNTSASLPVAVSAQAGGSSSTAGYSLGGTDATDVTTSIKKLLFSTEAVSTIAGTLPVATAGQLAMQSNLAVYLGGGWTSGTAIAKFTTDTETASAMGISMTTGSAGSGAASPTHGYFIGTTTGAGAGHGVDKLAFSGETIAQVSIDLTGTGSGSYANTSATTPDAEAGGAYTTQYSPNQTPRAFFCGHSDSNTVRCIGFADDVATNPSATIPTTVKSPAGLSTTDYGFLLGSGYQGNYADSSVIQTVTFGAETWGTESSALSVARYGGGCGTGSFGYVAGGRNSGGTTLSSCEKFTYGTRARSSVSATLANGRDRLCAVPSSTKAYYFPGGNYTTTIDGFLFSNDTAITVSATTIRCGSTGTSDGTTGYIYSGRSTDDLSYFNEAVKWDFGTESFGSTVSATAHWGAASAGDSGRGYAAGGYQAGTTLFSTINKLTYNTYVSTTLSAALGTANDVTTGLSYGNASAPAQTADISESASSSTTNVCNDAGDTGRGYATNGADLSLRKLQFDTLVFTTIASALAYSDWSAGAQSSDSGYFIGTATFGYVRKIAFSDDSLSTLAGSMSSYLYPTAVSASTKGYSMGGNSFTTAIRSITFSNDSTGTLSATLGTARHSAAQGIMSSTKGYIAGGDATLSSIDALTFSGETTAAISATLNVGRKFMASVQSGTTGYFAGGYVAAVSSEIDGLVFSGETATNPSAALPSARQGMTGLSSYSRGYLLGGGSSSYAALHYSSETIDGGAYISGGPSDYFIGSVVKSIPASSIKSASGAESASGSSAQDGAPILSSATTEAGSSTEASSILAALIAAHTASAASTDGPSAAAVLPADHAATASATAAHPGVAVFPSAVSEGVTSAESVDSGKLSGAAHSATATASSVEVGAFGFYVDFGSVVTAVDSQSTTTLAAVTASEPASSSAIHAALMALYPSGQEDASANATHSTTMVAPVASVEAASGGAVQVSAGANEALITESASASAAQSGAVLYQLSVVEVANGGVVQSSVVTISSTGAEQATAQDFVDWVGSIVSVVQLEPSTALDTVLGWVLNAVLVYRKYARVFTESGIDRASTENIAVRVMVETIGESRIITGVEFSRVESEESATRVFTSSNNE